MALKIIDHGSVQYQQMVKLRDDILRKPLGLSFTKEELENEKEHLLISGPGKYPDYNFYRVSGLAIAGKPKGTAQNEAAPVNVKSLLP